MSRRHHKINIARYRYNRIHITDSSYYCPDQRDGCMKKFELRSNVQSVVRGVADHLSKIHNRKKMLKDNYSFFVKNEKTETTVTEDELKQWFMEDPRPPLFDYIQTKRAKRRVSLKDLKSMKCLSFEMTVKTALQLPDAEGCISTRKIHRMHQSGITDAILAVIHQMGKQRITIPQFIHDDPTPHLCSGRWLIKLFMDQKDLGTKHSIIFGLRLLKRGIQLRYMKKRIFDNFLYKTLKEMWQEEATSEEHHIRLREIRMEILHVVNAYDDLFEDSRWVIKARKEIYFSNIFGHSIN
ncbi:hypothetical protein CAEBREN_19487 [Caenorhabditis brenneri]|uniref:Uncharacterized protein n=1 Tax=Caenorhabditis brenneri TaxID=135651 RepID=G0P0S3_CAEBE|nr:hypothetical protein CAEBREN_19487 [Caenorhabditis brenneri]